MAGDEPQVLTGRLAAHRVVGVAPAQELAWVAAHGQFRRLSSGDVLTSRAAGTVEGLFIVLSGHLSLYVPRANGREKIIEWRGGDVTGLLPFSRMGAPPGDSVAEEPTEVVVVPRQDLPALVRECPGLTAALVHVMVDRARHFTSSDLQAEKMVSLGKLSAGLAHELNNPAAAIARGAGNLRQAMSDSEQASRDLGALKITPEQETLLREVRRSCVDSPTSVVRSPLEHADREAEIADWLEAHGSNPGDAEALAETAVDLRTLERIAAHFSAPELPVIIRWLAAACLTRHLAAEVEEAAARVSSLVQAVKGFTHMDQSATPGPVQLADGLGQTLAILKSKARAKATSVVVEVAPALPPAHGLAGELNQVWANLIDNALDAVGPSGRVTVSASVDGDRIAVRVVDDGPGIAPEIQRRIFDPFFTTKEVGKGTGLGLDIVNRIVKKNLGTISVSSQPGRTEFAVSLPIHAAGEPQA